MAIGPLTPSWASLRNALLRVAHSCGAANAYVLDSTGHLWCTAAFLHPAEQLEVIELAQHALGLASPRLSRGGSLDRRVTLGDRHVHVRSFASIYIVMVELESPFADARARSAVDAALSDIQTFTLELPRHGSV